MAVSYAPTAAIRSVKSNLPSSGRSAVSLPRLSLFLVIQVAYHLDPTLTSDASCSAGRLKTASAIECDGSIIAGCDPESETSRSTRPSPGDDALDQREANAAPARRAVDKHADQRRP